MNGASRRRLLGHRCQIGIIIVVCIFNHVNDLIIYLRGSPLCIQSTILFQSEFAARSLSTLSVLIPTTKGIAGTCCRGRKRNLRAIRSSHCIDVLTATYIVGKSEVSSGIVYLQLLIRVSGNGDILITALEICIRVAVNLRSNFRVLNTYLIDSLDELVSFPIQVLQIMTNLIVRVCCDILVFFHANIFLRPFIIGEVLCVHRNGRSARIVSRLVGNFRCDGKTRRGNRVREVTLHKVIDLGSDIDSLGTIHIVIMDREFIGVDCRKYRNHIEALIYRITNCDLITVVFTLPVIKDLPFDERVVRHGRDLSAHSNIHIVLRLRTDHSAFIILHQEMDTHLICKVSVQRQILIHRRRGSILGTLSVRLGKPAAECCASFYRIRRQNNGCARGSCHLLVYSTINHECHSKNILLVRRYNGNVFRNHCTNCEFSRWI